MKGGFAMMLKRTVMVTAALILGLVPFLQAEGAAAKEVAGVNVPDTAVLDGSGESLVLNGAGVRKKFIVKVYVGALYLPAKTGDIDQIINGRGGRRMTMHFLYKEVETEKLVAGWNDGFAANLSPDELKAVKERLGRFNGFFQTVHSGDFYQMDFVPGTGTEVSRNGTSVGTVPGDDFYRALLKVWLGKKPADKGLKKSLLGK